MDGDSAKDVAHHFEHLTGRAPVVVLGILRDDRDEVVVVEGSQGVSEESIFEIGSVTKTFTALLLAEMCDRGEVALSDPVSRFLPKRGIASGIREITLLDLATHTARLPGVPRDLLWEAFRNRSNPYARYHRGRLEEALTRVRNRRGVGRRFRYSNFGFAVLGHALEKAAGVPYDELVIRRICEPLGLTSTSSASSGHGGRYLVGHRRIGKPVVAWDLASFGPAGVLKSSAHDMLTYVQAHLRPEHPALTNAVGEVQTPRVHIKRGRAAIGLAWLIMIRGGQSVVWHNGGTGGFGSFVGFNPRAGIGLVALANARMAGPLTRIGLRTLEQLAN
jgi:serine-type D-Ala-D-Ala carboxypeptidase/endopeptidase